MRTSFVKNHSEVSTELILKKQHLHNRWRCQAVANNFTSVNIHSDMPTNGQDIYLFSGLDQWDHFCPRLVDVPEILFHVIQGLLRFPCFCVLQTLQNIYSNLLHNEYSYKNKHPMGCVAHYSSVHARLQVSVCSDYDYVVIMIWFPDTHTLTDRHSIWPAYMISSASWANYTD